MIIIYHQTQKHQNETYFGKIIFAEKSVNFLFLKLRKQSLLCSVLKWKKQSHRHVLGVYLKKWQTKKKKKNSCTLNQQRNSCVFNKRICFFFFFRFTCFLERGKKMSMFFGFCLKLEQKRLFIQKNQNETYFGKIIVAEKSRYFLFLKVMVIYHQN